MAEPKRDILILDDDLLALQGLTLALSPEFTVHPFTDVPSAEGFLERHWAPLAIVDLHMPSFSGLEVLKRWKHRYPELEVIFCSGETRADRAIECIRNGACDYVMKPYRREQLLQIVRQALEKQQLKTKASQLGPFVQPRPVEFIGKSKPIQELLKDVQLLRGQLHLNVLILGESGTGKEVLASLLHQQEAAGRPFVIANMAAIPATLMEAELFGFEKGAFTDARQSRAGKFELADGGDIFLDEIGDLPVETQAKLLRALQEKQIERLGSHRSQKIQFRAISATHRPMGELITSGLFREDLMYRLSDMVLKVPPLRERREDIPLLVEHFVKKHSPQRQLEFSDPVIEQLLSGEWPGNVRQLESTIKRAVAFARDPLIREIEIYDLASMNPPSLKPKATQGFDDLLADYERKILLESLKRHGGDCSAAMRDLKLPRSTFYRKLSQYGLSSN